MAKLFDYNNPVWKIMGRVADVFFLTMLWLICSLPLVTIGASTTALYYVSLKMVRNRETNIVKSYFKCMKDNFLSSTAIWIILAAVLCLLLAEFRLQSHMEVRQASFFFWMWVVMAALYLLLFTVIFPLSARLDAGVGRLFFMAFMTAIKNFSWVLLMSVTTVCIIAIGIFVFWPVLLFSAGGIAYIHSAILEYIIFPKYNWNEK